MQLQTSAQVLALVLILQSGLAAGAGLFDSITNSLQSVGSMLTTGASPQSSGCSMLEPDCTESPPARVEQKDTSGQENSPAKELDINGPDAVLAHLEKAANLRKQGRYEDSNQHFEAAKQKTVELDAVSVAEQVGSTLINDKVKAYVPAGNEQLLMYAYGAINYLQMGHHDEAAVEARQFEEKHRLLVEKHPDEKYLSGAFVRYLNGMVFESVGERDTARIEYERAIEGYEAQSEFARTKVPERLKRLQARQEAAVTGKAGNPVSPGKAGKSGKAGKARQTKASDAPAPVPQPENGEVVFILENGRGPSLAENKITVPNPSPQQGPAMFSIALPKFVEGNAAVSRIVVQAGAASADGEMVEDITALAKKSLEDRLPGIQARAVLRFAAKAAISSKANQAGGGMFGLVLDIFNLVSEQADTRIWAQLPDNIQMARLRLPAGKHDIDVAFYSPDGSLLAKRQYPGVEVLASRRAFLTDHYE